VKHQDGNLLLSLDSNQGEMVQGQICIPSRYPASLSFIITAESTEQNVTTQAGSKHAKGHIWHGGWRFPMPTLEGTLNDHTLSFSGEC